MFNRDELKSVTVAVAAVDADFGSAVPINMRRFIYRVKFVNTVNAPNVCVFGKRENGAGATTVIDRYAAVVLNQTEIEPDSLEEDSAPLYIIEGPASNFGIVPVGNSTMRIACSAGGTGFFTVQYIDAPA